MCTLWVIINAWSVGLSIYLLVKNKLPSVKYIIISVILSVIAASSYLGYFFKFSMQIPISGIVCLLVCFAVFSVMEKYAGYELLKTDKKAAPLVSVLIGIGIGIVLGLINLLLAKNSMKADFAITFPRILVSLNPGIQEEIAHRAIFLAFFTYYFTMRNKVPSKFETFTMMFMMTVPHCLTHGYPLLPSFILFILFGLPFAILQRKRDLASAMISHTTVDLIRFVVFGLPL